MTLEGESLNKTVGATVLWHRERLGMSQTELARRMADTGLSWHQMTVARTESAERPLRLDEAIALTQIFQIELTSLINPPPTPTDDYLQLLIMMNSVVTKLGDEEKEKARLADPLQQAEKELAKAEQQVELANKNLADAIQRHTEIKEKADEVDLKAESSRRIITTLEDWLQAVREGRDPQPTNGNPPQPSQASQKALKVWVTKQIVAQARLRSAPPHALAHWMDISLEDAEQMLRRENS